MTAYKVGYKHAILDVEPHWQPKGWTPRRSFEDSGRPESDWHEYLTGYGDGYQSDAARNKAYAIGRRWADYHKARGCHCQGGPLDF